MKQLKIKQNNKKIGFLSMLFGTLGTGLLINLLACKGLISADEETIRVGQNFLCQLTL